MKLRTIPNAIGNGLVAGLLGTAAMTLSNRLEMKLRERPPSSTPAEGVCKALGIRAVNEEAQERLNTLIHWGYGSVWGAVRGLMDVAGIRGQTARRDISE